MAAKKNKIDKEQEVNIADAKKSTPINPRAKNKAKRKFKGISILLILIVLVGGIVFFFRNPIKSGLAKVTKNIPIVNNLFKQEDNPYAKTSKNDLIGLLSQSKEENEKIQQQIKDKDEELKMLQSKIDSLKQYEERYTAFEKQKQAWDETVAKTNPELFIEQYEQINAQLAEKIYKELTEKKVFTKTQKDLATTVGQMEEEQGAKAIEQLLKTDSELVKMIFEGMDIERRSLLLSAMESKTAAEVIKILSPETVINE